jgi:hypothetical protein
MDQRDWLDYSTLAIALFGAALSVFNAWRAWFDDRVKLRVRVAYAYTLKGEPAGLAIETVNLSRFAVTVDSLGFDLTGTDRRLGVPIPIFTQGERFPVRLEPRASLTVRQPLPADPDLAIVRNAYVTTACGSRCKSPRRVFRELNKLAAARAARPPGE